MNAKLKSLIVDDEPLAREVIRQFCGKYEELIVVGECGSGLQAVQAIEELLPDIVFLDVQMPDLNGFEVIKEVEGVFKGIYVFTTAHNQYAIDAFETNTVDYLLKPFTEQRFDKAVQKSLQFAFAFKQTHTENAIDRLLFTYNQIISKDAGKAYLQRVLVRESKKLFMVPLRDVYYFEGSGDYVKIQLHNKSHLINESLSNLENQLDPHQFMRIHRSFIVNMDYIKEFIPHFNSEYIIVLQNNMQVKMSRSYKSQFNQLIGKQF